MDENLSREIRDCLCGERTLFYYYPDQYAIYLLQRLLSKESSVNIACLRKSQWAGLLSRPILRELIAKSGSGRLDNNILKTYWNPDYEPYVLTLGEWGNEKYWSWNQTSRPGKNLVLQLNLSENWFRRFHRVVQREPNELFACGHPISETRKVTLAWARLDIDFDTDEVLIEEIQSDLVRYILRMHNLAIRALKNGESHFKYYLYDFEANSFFIFSSAFLEHFRKIWHEAMLAASIQFSFDELGISNLYYHSFETGNTMKNLGFSFPPRSLYTDLPKKFCFSNTNIAPQFLKEEKRIQKKLKRLKDSRWFYMAA